MKFIKFFFLPLIAVATSLDVLAEKIYKTVDEGGAVVFSDKKTPDAERIRVQPNVVDIRTPEMPEPTAEEKAKAAKQKEATQAEQTGRGTATAGNLKRKIRTTTNAGENIKRPPKQPPTVQPLPSKRPGAGLGGGSGGGGRAGGGR